jgi:hypothetical protein
LPLFLLSLHHRIFCYSPRQPRAPSQGTCPRSRRHDPRLIQRVSAISVPQRRPRLRTPPPPQPHHARVTSHEE